MVCYNDEIATQLVNALRKKGVDIPGAFSAWNNASLYSGLKKGDAGYAKLAGAGNSPTNCVACGACEAACPQHINIIEQLKCVTRDLA